MNKKPLILGLAFILPILVFLMLKFLGKNQFDVPPLFQTPGESTLWPECEAVQYPYTVEKDKLVSLLGNEMDPFTVITFIPTGKAHDVMTQIRRIADEMSKDSIGDYAVSSDSAAMTGLPVGHLVLSADAVTELRHCTLLMNESMDAVILDKEGTIRGQYDLDDLDDADRLIMELDILLKKY